MIMISQGCKMFREILELFLSASDSYQIIVHLKEKKKAIKEKKQVILNFIISKTMIAKH